MFKYQDVKIPNDFGSKVYHTCDCILNTKEDQLYAQGTEQFRALSPMGLCVMELLFFKSVSNLLLL